MCQLKKSLLVKKHTSKIRCKDVHFLLFVVIIMYLHILSWVLLLTFDIRQHLFPQYYIYMLYITESFRDTVLKKIPPKILRKIDNSGIGTKKKFCVFMNLGIVRIIKMFILSKLIYKVTSNSVRISAGFFFFRQTDSELDVEMQKM